MEITGVFGFIAAVLFGIFEHIELNKASEQLQNLSQYADDSAGAVNAANKQLDELRMQLAIANGKLKEGEARTEKVLASLREIGINTNQLQTLVTTYNQQLEDGRKKTVAENALRAKPQSHVAVAPSTKIVSYPFRTYWTGDGAPVQYSIPKNVIWARDVGMQ